MDGPPRSVAAVLALLLLCSAALTGVGAATPGTLFGVQSVDPDQVYIEVGVDPEGDAQWRIEYRVSLDSDNETAAFEDLTEDVEQNESAYLTDFTRRIEGTVSAAENSTGREMTASNFTVDAQIKQLPQQYGVLTYTFDWSNFGVVTGDSITAGDALAGFFLDSETTLALGWPADYEATTVSPEPTDRQTNAAVWRGPLDFGTGEPRIVVEPESAGGATTTDGAGVTPTPGGVAGTGVGLGMIVGILVAIALLGGAGFLYLRRNGLPGDVDLPTGESAAGGASDGSAGSGGGGAGVAGSGAGGGGGRVGDAGGGAGGDRAGGGAGGDGAGGGAGGTGGGAEAAAGGAAAGAGASDEEQPPEELLSNEERVVQFLEERGGRAKQQEIVDGLGWTDAKTSQVLSGMASEDAIEKFRIGRENVVKLPDGDDSLGPSE